MEHSTPSKRSFIRSIIDFARNDTDLGDVSTSEAVEADIPPSSSVPKKPISWGKHIKAISIVLIAFYVLLCVFVLLNPQYALFFNNVFQVEYITIRTILQYTIYLFYAIFGIFLGLLFLFFAYRGLVIKTKKRLKRALIWFMTAILGGLFFGNVALFALTYTWFLTIDFANLEERSVVYDNTLLKHLGPNDDIKIARLSTAKKIGPVNVRYDLSASIRRIVRTYGLLLDQGYTFEIDYNRDGKSDRGSGSNNFVHLPISDSRSPLLIPEFDYDAIGRYQPRATLEAIDSSGERQSIEIEMPEILIQDLVDVQKKPLKDGSISYVFDASSLNDLGVAHWSIIGSPEQTRGYQFSSEKITETPAAVCLKMVIGESLPASCDWTYVIEENTQSNITNMEIQIRADSIDPLKYQFSISPILLQGDIASTQWYIDGKPYVGKFVSGVENILDYSFKNSGTFTVEAEIKDSLGNKVRSSTGPIFTAQFTDLRQGYTLEIRDEAGNNLAHDAYDAGLQSFLLSDISVPTRLTFDATKIRASSPRLRLTKVEWDMDNDGEYESEGLSIEHELAVPGRYDFRAKYSFSDLGIDGSEQTILHIDKIATIGVQKPIDVRVSILPENNYAPTSVRFDASGSKIQKGVIQKFIYEFGDGTVYEGEGIVTNYRYKNPGEYKIKVTAVSDKGEKSSKEYTLILKKQQESISIVPSIASGSAKKGLPVNFTLSGNGNILAVNWSFGDNTPDVQSNTALHTFREAGIYTISARATYSSGVEQVSTLSYSVE